MTYTYKEIKDYDATTTPSLTDLLLKQESTGGIYKTITPNDILGLLSVSLLPSDVMLKSVYDTNTDGVIDTTALPTIPVSKGGTGTDLSTSTGLVKMASGVTSVASLLRSELPTGTLCVDSAISSTAQNVKDKDGNTSALALSNDQVEIRTTGYIQLKLGMSSSTGGFFFAGNQQNTHYSWLMGAQYNIDGGYEITPSTTTGGTTFTSPVLVLFENGIVRFPRLPTSASGLSSGDLWRDASGYVRIV